MTKRKGNAHKFRPKELEFKCINIEGEPIIKYRLPNIFYLVLKYGNTTKVPEPLVQLVMGEVDQTSLENLTASRKDLPTYGEWIEVMICHSAVSPKIVMSGEIPDYDKDQICVTDLQLDMLNLYNTIMTESNQARSFRDEQREGVEALPNGKDLQPETEQLPGD